jgi:protein-S-isoprenylcysteine O-methyltransferase Ste14
VPQFSCVIALKRSGGTFPCFRILALLLLLGQARVEIGDTLLLRPLPCGMPLVVFGPVGGEAPAHGRDCTTSITFWATPTMTVGHLVFAAVTTAYILVGATLEERDLVAVFGNEYRDYRKRVAMLIPWRKSI